MPLSRQSRRRWLAYSAAIFLAGATSGALLAWPAALRHRQGPPRRPMAPPSGTHLCQDLRHDLIETFHPTEPQLRALEPILDRRAQALDSLLDRSRSELEAIHRASNAEIAAALQLSPDQTRLLESLGRRGPGPNRGSPFQGPGGPPPPRGHGHFHEPPSHPPEGFPDHGRSRH